MKYSTYSHQSGINAINDLMQETTHQQYQSHRHCERGGQHLQRLEPCYIPEPGQVHIQIIQDDLEVFAGSNQSAKALITH